MRPGKYDASGSQTQNEPAATKPLDAVPFCSECYVALVRHAGGTWTCPSCQNPPWFQRMFVAYHCPKCRIGLTKERTKDGTKLRCLPCGLTCRVPG